MNIGYMDLISIRKKKWKDGEGGIKIIELSKVEFRMEKKVEDSELIEKSKWRYVIERIILRNKKKEIEDEDGYIELIIEMRDLRRKNKREIMKGEGEGKKEEERGIGRRRMKIIVLIV